MKVRYEFFFLLVLGFQAFPNVVEYLEDAYLLNVSQELVQKAEKVAQLIDYDKKFELVTPTKAGIQINPANNFIAQGINPGTHNDLIIVNQFWFSSLPDNQQTFLLGRSFETFKQGGSNPFSLKLINFIYGLISILLLIAFFLLLGFIGKLKNQKLLRALVALGFVIILESFVMDSLHVKVHRYFALKHDMHIIETVIEKTGDRQAALEALQNFTAGIKAQLDKGEVFWKPYEHTFESYIKALQEK
jgi:hypothetical protein